MSAELLDPASVAADLIGPAGSASQPPAPVQPVADGARLDGNGTVFDPKRHRTLPDGSPYLKTCKNGKTVFMPRGGRKAEATAPVRPEGTPQPSAPVTAQGELPLPLSQPEAPAKLSGPEKPAWTEAERAAAAAPAAQPEPASAAAQPADAELYDTSDDAAEVIAMAVFFLVGLLFGAPEEATPADAEQKKLVKITAGLIRTTGWKGSAWWAAGLSWCAYFLRFVRKPKAAARVQAWVEELRGKSKPVPAAPPVSAEPPTQPKPPQPATPEPPRFVAPTSGVFEKAGN